MKRIYIAGSYSADNVLGVLHNIGRGIRASARAIRLGHSVYCPWLDFFFALYEENEGICVARYQDNSMAWLEVSDEVWVLPGSENSRGTQAEIARAKELGIKVRNYDSI